MPNKVVKDMIGGLCINWLEFVALEVKMIKYLIMDVDGTLTDGKIYMGSDGEVMKAFSIKDGYVINFILKPLNIVPIIITARTSSIVQNRCDELGITEVYQGKLDKFTTLKEIVGEENLADCAYFGDDIIDIKCMKPIKEAGGIIACPADAVAEVKALADFICTKKSGEGALREFSEWLVKDRHSDFEIKDRVENTVEYLKKLKVTEKDAGYKVDVNDYFFYSVQSYDTNPAEKCQLESHRKYIDIQIIVTGRECMDFVDIARLSEKVPYDEIKDVVLWNIPERMSRTTLVEGDCIILYPETAHRGAQSIMQSEHVLKLVGKVKI